MTAAETLAAFTATLRWEDVPAPLQAKVKDHVLDTLGVMCAGVPVATCRQAVAAIGASRGAAAAQVVGHELTLPPANAAFLNALQGRIHTFDDTIESGPVHPGSIVVAAALSMAEARVADGPTFLASVAAGYEAVARVAAGFGPSHYALGFHNTGTCNVFGAAVAAARVLGLDAPATAGAIGLAGGMASGVRQYQVDGSMADSAMAGAHAALAGVLAAELAAAGLAGPRGILDGRLGVGALMSRDADFAGAMADLGRTWRFAAASLKPWPSCRFTHGPLQVIADLKSAHGFGPDDLAALVILAFHESIDVSDKPVVVTRTDALLSHQMSAALLLTLGRLDLAALDDAIYDRPDVRALFARIRVVHDAEMEKGFPAGWPHRVVVTLNDGRRLTGDSPNPPGGQDQPLARTTLLAKLNSNARPVLGPTGVDALTAEIGNLEHASDVRRLGRLLRPAASAAARAAE